MPGNRKSVYWDSCAFLSYVNAIPVRMPALDALLEQSAAGEITIYASTLSHVEVAFANTEKQSDTLSPEIERQINSLWADANLVTSVELHPAIALIALPLHMFTASSLPSFTEHVTKSAVCQVSAHKPLYFLYFSS